MAVIEMHTTTRSQDSACNNTATQSKTASVKMSFIYAIKHCIYLRLAGISLATGKCAEKVSILDDVTSNRIDTRGEGELIQHN